MCTEWRMIIFKNTPDGRSKVALMVRDGMVFGTSVPNIFIYVLNIFINKELD